MKDNSTAQLLPCPFCGGTDLTTTHTTGFWAQCEASGCQAEGPVKVSEDGAIAAWNTRAPVSQDAAQLVERLRRYAAEADGDEDLVSLEPGELRHAADLIEALTRPQPSTSSVEAVARDGRFWILLHEPGCTPERKGPFSGGMVKVIREFIEARPTAYIDVMTLDSLGQPTVAHGPEMLQMLDGRSMSTGRKHNARTREAHAPHHAALAAAIPSPEREPMREALVEFDDGAGVAYTIGKLREELDELYRREPPKDAPKVRPGRLHDVGVSVISRLQHIDHLQRYQIACLEHQLAVALNPPKHKFWGAGEPDCPREIKAGNGELHTLRCKVCGQDDPRDDRCLTALAHPQHNREIGHEAAPVSRDTGSVFGHCP